jgi:hypothetical protein
MTSVTVFARRTFPLVLRDGDGTLIRRLDPGASMFARRLVRFVPPPAPLALALTGLLACSPDGSTPVEGAQGVGSGKADDPGQSGPGGGSADLCAPLPACDAAPPPVGDAVGFRHTGSWIVANTGFANHRGRDLLLLPGDPQTVIGKLAYGVIDKDLEDEDVDVWLLRGCGGDWELLGTARTTDEDSHAPVEGIADSGGRIFFDIPADRALEPGRHRIHLSVAGDRTGADMFIQVAPAGTQVVVSDVDGTLTTSETEEFTALLTGDLPDANPGAREALSALAARGYLPLYLTARPELLVGRTRDFLAGGGFPPGLVHTTTQGLGALGGAAATFKTDDLERSLIARGYLPAFAFGNTSSDADAYDAADVQPPTQRLFFQFSDEAHGGRRFDDYAALLPELEAAPDLCQ